MTLEELDVLLQQANDPNTAQAALISIREGVNSLLSERDVANSRIEEMSKNIDTLRNTNAILFTKVTGHVDEEPEEEKRSFTEIFAEKVLKEVE